MIGSGVEEVTEEDCIQYMLQLVIERTYDGYTAEIRTVYGQLQSVLGRGRKPAAKLFNHKGHEEMAQRAQRKSDK